jgi:hypothetical protein
MRRLIRASPAVALAGAARFIIDEHGTIKEFQRRAGVKDGKEWFEKNAPTPRNPVSEPAHEHSDKLKIGEYETAFGKFERRPPSTPTAGAMEYGKYNIKKTQDITGGITEGRPMPPIAEGHHPFYDYTPSGGVKEGYNTKQAANVLTWDINVSKHGLYRQSMKALPLIKQYYMLLAPLEWMQQCVRKKFEENRNVNDSDAVRHLLQIGWLNYTDIITFRMQKNGVQMFFGGDGHDSSFHIADNYAEEEKAMQLKRQHHNGEERSKDGPFGGYHSLSGKQTAEEFEKLQGRVPMSWSASKGYFECWKPDGTNFWEKNLDYEGWYIKNVDPDRSAARKEIQGWTEAGYNQPKHYASKNRRAYRRFVKDTEDMFSKTTHELYSESREAMFQSLIRDWCPESNRISAEKRMAMSDDDVFTSKTEEVDAASKQMMREFPNPRLWKTDAAWLRMRVLMAPYELNWAKAPVGVAFERQYNEWVSADVNHTIVASAQFAAVKADKAKNPMARSWSDFYAAFDPDAPATRRLPWYHADFDYDRRHFWDERCMRMKKWAKSGDVDFAHDFFAAEVYKWEDLVNRPEIAKRQSAVMTKYTAPRMVQLYRSLGKRMDVALANQLAEFMVAQKTLAAKAGETHGSDARVAEVAKALAATDFKTFVFVVPAVVLPDAAEHTPLELDGRSALAHVE